MSCLSLLEIDNYLEREITPEKAKSLEEHLLRCPRCRAAVESRRHFLQACSHLPDLPLPFNWAKKVMARISSLGPILPIFILAAIGGLGFLLISLRLTFLSLQPEASATAFKVKLPLLPLVKSAFLFLLKITLALASSLQTFLRPECLFFSKTGWPFSLLALELGAALFIATVISVFLLAHYYRPGLTKEKL